MRHERSGWDRSFFCAYSSDARNDVSHKVCIDPADRACIGASYLDQGWHFWILCTFLLIDDITHLPGLLFCHYDDHPWFDA